MRLREYLYAEFLTQHIYGVELLPSEEFDLFFRFFTAAQESDLFRVGPVSEVPV